MKRGRKSIDPKDKKKSFGALVPEKVIDYLGSETCKYAAEEAVMKLYDKTIKIKRFNDNN